MLLREADCAHVLVITWAYIGIAPNQDEPLAVLSALLGALAVASSSSGSCSALAVPAPQHRPRPTPA